MVSPVAAAALTATGNYCNAFSICMYCCCLYLLLLLLPLLLLLLCQLTR
jgi:hypothetical protein